MGFRDREIEKKFHTNLVQYEQVCLALESLVGAKPIVGNSSDIYWHIPNKSHSFSRLRQTEDCLQLTVKKQDKKDHTDRIEIDLDLQPTSIHSVMAHQEVCFGPKAGEIEKNYAVWKLNDSKFNTISCYEIRVNGEPIPGVFIEAEGETIGIVDAIVHRLLPLFSDLNQCEGSLYTMYLQPKPRGSCI